MTMKQLATIRRSQGSHWVGDGFPVRNLFSYRDIAQELSPFLLMDYAGPVNFDPTLEKRGVGEHPHRGFETVTIVYAGEVEHRDSSGGGGKIGPGEVQWMTAASGVVHEEFHGTDYARKGGPFEMVQLWVNLPKKDKMSAPGYQGLTRDRIPEVELAGGAGKVRVIAGEYAGARGPARTFTPMHLWDGRLRAGARLEFAAPEGWTTALFVLSGGIQLPSGEKLGEAELALLTREGSGYSLEATADAKVLFMIGQPLDEPIVGHGPFVMNTEAEIRQAFLDFQTGKMGQLVRG